MSLVTLTYVFSVGATIIASQHNTNFSTIYNDYNGNITDANIAPTAGIEYTKLSLNNTIRNTDLLTTTVIIQPGQISGAAITLLPNVPSGAGPLPLANAPAYPYVKVSNTQTSGTHGGTSTSGSWLSCILNTKDNDTGGIATLTSNKVTLPSGTYKVIGMQSFDSPGTSQIRIYNATDSAILLNGFSCTEPGTNNHKLPNVVSGQFTIASSKDIVMQYQVGNGVSVTGLGEAVNFGTEVYATVEFTKIA